LVIIVTPYIIPKSKDLTYIRAQLAQLKMLEDKYTKDLSLRLDQMKLQEGVEDLQRDKAKLVLEETKDELKEDQEDFAQDKKEYEEEKREALKEAELSEEDKNLKLHQERLHSMFGI
jgi:general secretion pathway protein D